MGAFRSWEDSDRPVGAALALVALALYPAAFVINVVLVDLPEVAFDWIRLLLDHPLLALAHAGLGSLLGAALGRWWVPLIGLGLSPVLLLPTYFALAALGIGSIGE